MRQSSPNDERHARSVEANDIGAGDRRGRCRATVVVAAALACLCVFSATATSAGAESATYSTFSAIQSVPVPPASSFAGSGGGDGWAVALSSTDVFNIFHHQTTMQLSCHHQANAEACYQPETISEGVNQFAVSGHPGMHLDQATGKLYVFGTRTSDGTVGVVCIDTTLAPTNSDPFCGFTALTPAGGGVPLPAGISGVSPPMLIGTHLYSFNSVSGASPGEGKDELLCFDVSTLVACSGQPFAVSIGAGNVSDGGFPSSATAAVAGKVIIPLNIEGQSGSRLACFDDATQSSCAGSWPVQLSATYATNNGSPFPLLDGAGNTTGVCIPTGADECFNLNGESTATPAGMTSVITASDGWNGPAFVLGPRVYLANGNAESVECFDYSTGASCSNFPKKFANLGYIYTVNPDPQRPTCIWVNSDDGSQQIQDFDAYTGEACGGGTVRVLASQFVAPAPQCAPANYVSLQVLQPSRSSYSTGSVAFANGDGELIPGLPEIALDETGSASLNGLDLNTTTGLPQFLFTLQNPTGPVGSVEVRLTWEGNYDESCAGEGRTVVRPPAPPATPAAAVAPAKVTVTPAAPAPKPVGGVLPFGNAHIASHTPACVASAGYLAAVSGKAIASVTFTLDGHKIATVSKPGPHGVFATRVRIAAGGRHKLTMHVTFTAASHTAPQNISRTLARCAVSHPRPTPRFTG